MWALYIYNIHSTFCELFRYSPVWDTNPAQSASTFRGSGWERDCSSAFSWKRRARIGLCEFQYVLMGPANNPSKNDSKTKKVLIDRVVGWFNGCGILQSMHSMFCGLFRYNPVWGTNPVQVPSASAILSGQEFVAAESPGRGEGRQIELSKKHQNHVNFNIESKRFLDFGKFTALMGVGLVVYAFYVLWTVSLQPCMKHQSRSSTFSFGDSVWAGVCCCEVSWQRRRTTNRTIQKTSKSCQFQHWIKTFL